MAWRRATNFRQTSPFPFYERCLFRGVFLVNKRRGLSNFLSPVLSPDAVSSRSERWYTSLRHVIWLLFTAARSQCVQTRWEILQFLQKRHKSQVKAKKSDVIEKRSFDVPLSAVSLASKRCLYIRKPSNLPTKRTDRAVKSWFISFATENETCFKIGQIMVQG